MTSNCGTAENKGMEFVVPFSSRSQVVMKKSSNDTFFVQKEALDEKSEKMIDEFWTATDTQCHNLLVAVPKLEVTLENVVVCQIQPTCVSLGSYSEQKSFHCCKMINHV